MSEPMDPRNSTRVLLAHRSQTAHEEGEGNWLVSYADMMTLLVGFFVILLSFASIDQDKFDELRMSASREFGGTYQTPFGDVANRIKAELEKLKLGNQFVIKQNPLGVEISFLGTVFFDTGSADLKPEGSALLTKLIPVIRAQSTDFSVMVEGHTDDVPISAGLAYKTNWELSSVRACRVLNAFEEAGFSKARLTAVGYGDARPIVPNENAAGNPIAENRNQNRRVVIKLIKPAEPLAGGAAPAPAALPEQS